MMGVQDWRDMAEDRRLQQWAKRLESSGHDQAEETLELIETLREWSIIDEDEYRERRHALTDARAAVTDLGDYRTVRVDRGGRRMNEAMGL